MPQAPNRERDRDHILHRGVEHPTGERMRHKDLICRGPMCYSGGRNTLALQNKQEQGDTKGQRDTEGP
ncbi:unnamed protein product [Boreogadus saida]